jgi:hypothetical protein
VPGSHRSLLITDAFRQRLVSLGALAEAHTLAAWRTVDLADLDGTHAAFVAQATVTVTAIQARAAALAHGYLTAFLASELGHPAAPPPTNPAAFAGVARTGRPLAEAFAPTVITVKTALGEGLDPGASLERGQHRARRLAGAEALAAGRGALMDGISTDERIVGWERATSGGCGACIAAATRTYGPDEPLPVHDNCQCTAEPVVADVPNRAPRPDGADIFDGMSREAQDQLLGPDKAELIRSGRAPLHSLIEAEPMAEIPDQITEAPLQTVRARAS